MPKTLPIPRQSVARGSVTPSNLGALALFVCAYLAVLGVMFAPEGFFLGAPEPVVAQD
jgi:hypothetical protein